MGAEARLNPHALAGKDPAQVHAARLQRFVQETIQTPLQYQRFLGQFAEDAREDVRRLTRPFCEFVPAAIAEEEALIAQAATVAARTAGV